jgi:hypothetical protein
MDGKEILREIREALVDLKASGEQTVSIQNLERYCDVAEAGLTASIEQLKMQHASDLEQYRATYMGQLEGYKAQMTARMEMFRSVIESGREALNAAVLINGGAVVVIVGFLGAMVSRNFAEALVLMLTEALRLFGFGVLSAALAFGGRYVTQAFYGGDAAWHKSAGIGFHALSVVLAVSAYVFFGLGVSQAYEAFSSYFTTIHLGGVD